MNSNDVVKALAEFRRCAKEEAGITCLEIDATVALVLADVCDALGLEAGEKQAVLGDVAYHVLYNDQPIAAVTGFRCVCGGRLKTVTLHYHGRPRWARQCQKCGEIWSVDGWHHQADEFQEDRVEVQ